MHPPLPEFPESGFLYNTLTPRFRNPPILRRLISNVEEHLHGGVGVYINKKEQMKHLNGGSVYPLPKSTGKAGMV